ncbi:two-component sensor histidine kinase, partial [Klebsiella oxytoca]
EEDNEEFYHMKESFNHMSLRLKNQFDKIYLEEIALRDAKIMALQSQINPHFLNNTLEIINWEARLNGNEKV